MNVQIFISKKAQKELRSSYLSRSWRVIYTINEERAAILIEILEINHHDY